MAVTTAPVAVQGIEPNRTTRALCSAVLTRVGFAELVYRTLCVPRVRALAPAPGVDLVLLARHAAYAVRQRQRRQAVLSMALPAAALPLAGMAANPGAAGLWIVLVLAVIVATMAWAVSQDFAMAQRATRLIDPGPVEDPGPGLVDADVEQRLAAVNDANLSLYAWERVHDPFPGLGQRIDAHVRMPVDIGRAEDPKRPVQPLTTSELLDHLARRIPGYIDLSNINNTRRVRMVLYVLGNAAKRIPGLLPDPEGPPEVRVPPAMLRQTADRPSGEARTYLRAQIIGHGGDVITTVHLTAVAGATGLSLDLALHVLRPIHGTFYAADRLPRSGPRLACEMVRRHGLAPRMLSAPGDVLRTTRLLRDGNKPAKLTREQRKAVGEHDFYGANVGLREATSYNSSFGFNESNDAERQFNDIMVAVMRELIAFLESHNIDTSDFRQQQTQVINNVTSAINTTVNGTYVGGNGTMHLHGNQQINANNLPNLGPSGP